jgi:hypothetical protein
MKLKMTKGEQELIDAHNLRMRERQLANALKETDTRARSFTVGTAFGGALEVSMRGDGGAHMWAILQPVEAIEVLHQMAAAVGCHMHLTPRRDFAAWRNWKNSPEELEHFRGVQHLPGVGHPPHAKALVEGGYDTSLPPPEQQPGMAHKPQEAENEVMAAKAPE